MKQVRKLLDRIEPAFTEGKLKKLYPLYEAIDTFLFTPGKATKAGSHIRDSLDLKRMMSLVLVALLPCIFMAFYNTGRQANLAIASSPEIGPISNWKTASVEMLGFGYDPNNVLDNFVHGGMYFLPVYLVTMAVGGAWEFLFSVVRKHEINEGFLVTGILFPLTLPPTIPLWQVALGISFGVVIGKEVFGGTGRTSGTRR